MREPHLSTGFSSFQLLLLQLKCGDLPPLPGPKCEGHLSPLLVPCDSQQAIAAASSASESMQCRLVFRSHSGVVARVMHRNFTDIYLPWVSRSKGEILCVCWLICIMCSFMSSQQDVKKWTWNTWVSQIRVVCSGSVLPLIDLVLCRWNRPSFWRCPAAFQKWVLHT